MKKYNSITLKAVALIMVLCLNFSCGDEKEFFADVEKNPSGVHVKILHASFDGLEYKTQPPPPGTAQTLVRSTQFYLNSSKVTGTTIAYGAAFPPNDYAVLESTTSLNAIAPYTPATPPAPELLEKVILNPAALELNGAGYYTAAVIGPEAAREVVVYEDKIDAIPVDGKTYIRFINLMANSVNGVNVVGVTPIPAGGTAGTPITLFQNVAYKQISGDFIVLEPGAYTTVQVKDAVTGTVLATMSGANSTWHSNRVYTLFVRGQQGITSAADPKRPVFERMVNR